MTGRARLLIGLAVLAVGAGCGGGTSTLVPHGRPTGEPTGRPTSSPVGTPTPTPTPSAVATLSVAAVTTALESTQTYFSTLPHQDLETDLTSLATHMVSSGAFSSAAVTYGGISAKLPDGTPALVFADHLEDLGGVAASARSRNVPTHPQASFREAVGGPNQHEILFLYNDQDTASFSSVVENGLGTAFTNVGFPSAGYGVDVLPVTLDNIVAVGKTHPLDFFQLATHGMVAESSPAPITGSTFLYYANESTTRVNSAYDAAYKSDIRAGRLVHAFVLQYPTMNTILPTYAFTPDFLAEQLAFNPGSIVDFEACYGQNESISASVAASLGAAGAGRYLGWTKSVTSEDSEQTDAFIVDRLLGEQSPSVTTLDDFAVQRIPPQRPFPLDDIIGIAHTEDRAGPMGGGELGTPETYDVSDQGDHANRYAPPLIDGTKARLVTTPLGGSTPIFALPSISQMAVTDETTAGGTLRILGSFPSAQGTVTITDGSGTTALPVLSWTTDTITASLAQSGNGSAGLVQVFAASTPSNLIGSNLTPLTQWTGTVTYTESDTLSNLNGVDGDGAMGSLEATFALTFRSDVHPTVPTIDTSPVPQNLTFPEVEGNSTAAITALSGTFTSVDGTPPPATANFSLSAISNMTPATLPAPPLAASTFVVGAVPGQPLPCNSGTAGPEGNTGNVFCPAFGYHPPLVGVCSPDADDTDLCGATTFSPGGSFGEASLIDPGIVTFTMDPTSYAISVTGASTSFTRPFQNSSWPATASVTGTFNAPSFAPTGATPAYRLRAAERSLRRR